VGVTPAQVVHHHLNLAGQNVLTTVSWALTVVLLVVAYRMCRKERTPFYVVMVLASIVGALAEPLYDVMFSLYFYSGPKMQTTFSVFGIPQPVWAYSGYAILYALPAIFIVREIQTGKMTPARLWKWAAFELVESCIFEIAGINIGTYTYWGPHVFRMWHYPIVIGVLEAAQVMTFAVAAANLRHRTTAPWQSLALFAIFPVTMLGVNFGAGWPEILSIHAPSGSVWVVRACTVVSIGLAAVWVRLMIAMIPPFSEQPGQAGSAAATEGEVRVQTTA
jgi:hypothetical protein